MQDHIRFLPRDKGIITDRQTLIPNKRAQTHRQRRSITMYIAID